MKKIKNSRLVWLVLGLVLLLAVFLRFYKLSQFPSSLYWEEAALGYDAYSLLKTGRDHRGNSWPIVYLESFMDFKPPLYVYTLIPSIAVFGLNEFSVRFPSALFGTLTVLVVYFLTKELFKSKNIDIYKDKNRYSKYSILNFKYLPLIAVLLLAISPWHLQFSRAAFEANLALFLTSTGAFLFLKSFKKNYLLIFSAGCFGLSLYAYHGARVFSFLLVLILTFVFLKRTLKIKKIILIMALALGLVLSFPLISSLKSGQVQQRFQETSVFATLDPVLESNKKIEKDRSGVMAKVIHHRFWEYSRLFLNQYFTHFSGSFLFLSGDINPRHSIQEFGQLYHWEIVTLILGVVFLLKNFKRKQAQLILAWLLIGPVPGAITKAAPHSLRTIFSLPIFMIISSLGLVGLFTAISKSPIYIRKRLINKKPLFLTVGFIILIEFIFYLHFYYHHYPKLYSAYWQYGLKEAVGFIKENENKYESIYLTNAYGRAYMYYLFYTQMDPLKAQDLVEPYKSTPDIPRLGKVFFNLEEDSLKKEGSKNLMVGSAGEIPAGRLLKTINFLDENVAFEIREQ
ncbi:hypothetical protein COT75_01770 [Candidatus Beckwithbacteria bacterium CG10_big_fil_rev_8_21_14_0_10_34_10]|uniref:ArnT-like N-terminal domain-containing protein n=1 Tax=Candidatus Beckwithbacteria bacterium CG10_big_fil_rev_8_21_14_0_10_34_10 TaxID=1974495 RepID=A0A2H0W9P3_9BACT|nr:MAG: hypothetical protein COT75_01770 [Candidatus Beckwithbacteria bacterium CG10_big_fil_rev_8_21_14_0_10_34_10]